MKKLLLTILLIGSMAQGVEIRLVSQVKYLKEVNSNSGFEITPFRGTIFLNDEVDLKFGMSESYTGFRSSPYNLNHNGTRLDYGFNWKVPLSKGLRIGYTHSSRMAFEGTNPVDIFDNDSVDSIYIRYEWKARFME